MRSTGKTYYLNNKEKYKNYAQKYYRQYYIENLDDIKEKTKTYRLNNIDQLNEYHRNYSKTYYQANKQRYKDYYIKKKAEKASEEQVITIKYGKFNPFS